MESELVERLHGVQIMALNELDRVCKKYGLTYFLIGGTLLGAVRHNGFIPWDDDIDVAMPRNDFNLLQKIAKENLKKGFFFQSAKTDKEYGRFFGKIRVEDTLFIEKGQNFQMRHHGIFIDIFPLDIGSQKGSLLSRFKIKLSESTRWYIMAKRENRSMKRIRILNLIPELLLVCLSEYLVKGKGDYYINFGSQYGVNKQTIDIKHYMPCKELLFEGKKYPVPKDYDYILSRIYGKDYMSLPPIEKRVTHNPVRLSFNINEPDEIMESKN